MWIALGILGWVIAAVLASVMIGGGIRLADRGGPNPTRKGLWLEDNSRESVSAK